MVVLHLWYLYSLCGGFGSTNLPTPSMFFLRLVSICIFKQSSAILNFGELFSIYTHIDCLAILIISYLEFTVWKIQILGRKCNMPCFLKLFFFKKKFFACVIFVWNYQNITLCMQIEPLALSLCFSCSLLSSPLYSHSCLNLLFVALTLSLCNTNPSKLKTYLHKREVENPWRMQHKPTKRGNEGIEMQMKGRWHKCEEKVDSMRENWRRRRSRKSRRVRKKKQRKSKRGKKEN